MQNEITVFNFKQNPVRTVLIDGAPWFVAKDVCDILAITYHRDAIGRLSQSQRGSVIVDTLGGFQSMAAVNEAGLYKLIFSSRKPEAEEFTDWVAEEVLPTIRKTGSFSLNSTAVIDSSFLKKVAEALEEKEKQLLEMKPKAEFFDAVASSKTAIPIGNVAKILEIPGIGRNILFQILREQGLLMHDNVPYQQYIDRGYFRVIEQKYNTPEGETKISIKTLVYQKGIEYIRKVVKQHNLDLATNASRLIEGILKQPPTMLQGIDQ